MPYYNVTPNALYQSCISNAWEWVEAENIYEVWKLVQEWYELMESGEAANRFPDPFWKDEDYPGKATLTQDVADTFIEELDADFMLEKNRFHGRLAPEFSRLPPHARVALVQEAYKIIKTSAAIEQETKERLAAGEKLPNPTSN